MAISDIIHKTAGPNHYDKQSIHYDDFNENNSIEINRVVEKILKDNNVKTVLDFSCGTGSQVFWLAKKGFIVTGLDISDSMLKIAKSKAAKQNLFVKLVNGDMRLSKVGKFDAVITIFNSIGHLTIQDFNKAIKNIHNNLNDGGVFIFDIFNLSYLLYEDNITKLTIDWQKSVKGGVAREIQYSTITKDGILASYDIYHKQIGSGKPIINTDFQTLQIYSSEQLKDLLIKNGLSVLCQTGIDGLGLDEYTTERILTVAKK